MYPYVLSISLAMMLTFSGMAQNVQNHVDYFNSNLKRIETKKAAFTQSFGIQEGKNEQCLIWYQKTPLGKGDEERFEFNAADLNENRIQFDTQRDLVVISAPVKGKKKLIREYKDGEVSGYVSEVEINAPSIEEARKVVEELKTLAASCDANMAQKSGVGENASKAELLAYLVENIREVQINEDRFEQNFSFDPQNNSLITYTTTDVSDSKTNIYRVNAMDLNFSRTDFNTERTKVVIHTEVKGKRNLIQVEENGELENYTTKLEILASDIENARNLATALKDLARISNKEQDEAVTLRSDNTPASAVAFLEEKVGEVSINEDTYRQSFNADKERPYLITYVLEDLGDDEILSYQFNLSDLDPSTVDFDVNRNSVVVTAKTQGNGKLIQESKNKVVAGYESNLSIRVSDIESARELQSQLFVAVKHYRENRTDNFSDKYKEPTRQQALQFSKEHIGKIVIDDEAYIQTFKVSEEGDCLVVIEIEDVDKGETIGYSFNWSDINPGKIDFTSKGKELFLSAQSKGGKELIQVIEDGEVDDYEKDFQIRCTDVESARALAAAWKVLAESCGEK